MSSSKEQPRIFNGPLVVGNRLVVPVYKIRAVVRLGWPIRFNSNEVPVLLELDV